MAKDKQITGFYAYSANPLSLAEAIENAIEKINSTSSKYVQIHGWKGTATSGTSIIREVCNKIDQSDLFMCDLTKLSMNVLFELGYAIAKGKRIVTIQVKDLWYK